MKKRFILLLKVLAWMPLFLSAFIFFLPIWLITGNNTLDWFEKFDDSFYSNDSELPYFNPPPMPKNDKWPETPVDKPYRY